MSWSEESPYNVEILIDKDLAEEWGRQMPDRKKPETWVLDGEEYELE
jgi:hypothetical protein